MAEIEYPSIENVFFRDPVTHKLIEGKWRLPVFEYLKDNRWRPSEKIDGTNIRISADQDKPMLVFNGRTANAQIPGTLLYKLQSIFSYEKWKEVFPTDFPMLYGEGFGPGIQKGGKYGPAVDFALFDVRSGNRWLSREEVAEIAQRLGIKAAPEDHMPWMTLLDAIALVKAGVKSYYGDFISEGLVVRPEMELRDQYGQRVIAKIKHDDFA